MDRFIVGTGRCGSTLLSRMLAESPEVASLFEFFNGLEMGRRFSDEPAGGEEFAWLISQKHPFVTMVLSRGYDVPEIIYPFSPGSRFQKGDGLPWIVQLLQSIEDGEGEASDLELLSMHTKYLGPGHTFCALAPGAMEPLTVTGEPAVIFWAEIWAFAPHE